MKVATNLGRFFTMACFLSLLAACGGGEPQTQSETESHGHAHD
jgi:hypothetical protein